MALLARLSSERRCLLDPVTGARIEQLTAWGANHWPLSAPDTPFTPGGESLLFLSDRAGAPHLDLFTLEMRTGAMRQLTDTDRLDPNGITPAANGREAIAGLRGEEGEVVAIDLETGEWETLAVFLGAELDGCHCSASGEYIVTVVSQEEEATITAVHTEGMRTVPILTSGRGLAAARFSPDSKNSVLYVTPTLSEIRCVEFDGTGDRELVSGVQVFRRSDVQGPTKTGLPLTLPDTEYEIRNCPERLNARTRKRVPAERLISCPPTWLGSGEEVLFVAGAGEGPPMAVSRHGDLPREIAPLVCRWARSDARGEQIVAVASSLDRRSIVLADPSTGVLQPLCSSRSAQPRPCFSPDGCAVVYADQDEQGCSQLFLATLHDANGPGAPPVIDLEREGA